MKYGTWQGLIPADYPKGRSDGYMKRAVEAAVHEAGHAVAAVILRIPFESIGVDMEEPELVPVPGQLGRGAAATGGFVAKGPIGVSKFMDYALVLAAGKAASRLILGWASPRGDLQERADFEEALRTGKKAYPDMRILDKVGYNHVEREVLALLRDTSGAISAIEHIARELLAKGHVDAADVIAQVTVFVPVASS